MFDINKLYNSDIAEIADIAELIYDRDGTTKGLEADDVQKVADLLMSLEVGIGEMIEQERRSAYDDAVEDMEEKYDDISKEIEKCKEEAYDKGFEDGYEEGSSFKDKLEKIG